MKHLVFIVNPRSGVERQKAIQQAVETSLDHRQYSYNIVYTEYIRHGIPIAKEAAAAGAYAVVAIGGDGSVNDVARGLLGTETALAIIPKGSGNGLARSLSIPLHLRKAIEVINKGNSVMMDVGHANGNVFISNAGVGFDTVITAAFAKSLTRGFRTYTRLIAKHLWHYRPVTYNIRIDGEQYCEKAFLITIANGRQLGYNFTVAPQASWTDGLLDVVIIRKFPKLMSVSIAIHAMLGNIRNSSYVQHYQAKEVIIESVEIKLLQTDGDAHPCNDSVRFSVEPGALRVIVP